VYLVRVGVVLTAQPNKRKTAKKLEFSHGFGSNLAALVEMLDSLRDAGRLERVDAARVQIALRLARAVDENPENVGLWQQYRAAENVLREVTNDDVDGLAELFASFDAEVRNASNGIPPKRRK
jgi:hypothetical protein